VHALLDLGCRRRCSWGEVAGGDEAGGDVAGGDVAGGEVAGGAVTTTTRVVVGRRDVDVVDTEVLVELLVLVLVSVVDV